MLADTIAAQLSTWLGSVIDTIMTGIWVAAIGMLRGAFQLVDTFTTADLVGVDTVTVGIDGAARPLSPLGAVWPVLRWLSLAIAVGLFFVQLAATMLRGGRGLFRLVTGPFAYAVAVAMTAGGITLLFAAADGITTVLLGQGLRADGFVGVLDSDAARAVFTPAPTLGPVDPGRAARGAEATSQLDATARAVTLGVVALVGVIPAAFGFALESVFRLAAFLVLVATSPISAAGLLSDATAAWYWRGLRWAVAAAVMKPALALVLVVGVNVLSAPTGVAGLIAGAGVLLVALFAPFTVYRLLAFVDPGTNAGAAARATFSRLGQRGSNASGQGETADGAGEGGGGAEAAHAARFDAADPGGAGGAGGGAGGAGGGAGGAGGGAGGGAAGSGAAVAGGGGAGAAGAAGGAAVAGVALVAAAGQFAGRYAGQTMDAAAVGHPHGGRGGAPPAARHGGGAAGGPGSPADRGHTDPGDPGDTVDPDDRADYGDSPATWGAPPDLDPGYDPGYDRDTAAGGPPRPPDPGYGGDPDYGQPGYAYGPGYGWGTGDPDVPGAPGPDAGGGS